MVPFAISSGDVVEVTITFVKFDQEIQNKIDVLAGGPAFTSADLLIQMGTDWGGAFAALLSADANFTQARAQKITDVLAVAGKPRRVRGELDVFYPNNPSNTFGPYTATSPHLPMDVTMSIGLQTAGNPSKNWGRKSMGPLPESVTGSDGEITILTVWNPAAAAFFLGTHAVGATGGTYRVVVIPGTAISKLALPHAAIGTLVNNVTGVNVGAYVGSQGTRRLNPNSTRGH